MSHSDVTAVPEFRCTERGRAKAESWGGKRQDRREGRDGRRSCVGLDSCWPSGTTIGPVSDSYWSFWTETPFEAASCWLEGHFQLPGPPQVRAFAVPHAVDCFLFIRLLIVFSFSDYVLLATKGLIPVVCSGGGG